MRQRAGGGVHDHQAVVAAPHASPSTGAGWPRCCSPTTGSPCQLTRRVRDRPGRRLRAPATGRRREGATAATCSAIVDAERDWDRGRARGARARSRRPARWRRGGRRAGHRRQHGGRARPRPAAAATWRCRSAPRAPCTRSATTPTADPTGAVAGFADATGRFLPLVCTLNATKVTDAVARPARRRPRRARPAGAAASRRAPAAWSLAAVPRRRAHAQPARRHRRAGRPAHRTSTASRWPAPPSRAWCAGCSTGSTRSAGGRVPTAGRLVLIGGGARSAAYRQLLADLRARAVTVPAELERGVAAGACVQAAAVLHQRPSEHVAAAWDLCGRHGGRTRPGGVGCGRRARRLRRPPRRRSLTVPTRPTRPVAAEPDRWATSARPGATKSPNASGRADVRPRSLAGWTIPSPCSACPRRRRSTTCGPPGGGWPSRSTPTTAATRRGCGESTGLRPRGEGHPPAARGAPAPTAPTGPAPPTAPARPGRPQRSGRRAGRRVEQDSPSFIIEAAAGRGVRGAARRGQLDRRGDGRRSAVPARRPCSASRSDCWCRHRAAARGRGQHGEPDRGRARGRATRRPSRTCATSWSRC